MVTNPGINEPGNCAGLRRADDKTQGTYSAIATPSATETPAETNRATCRELEVLSLIAAGATPSEIAGELNISYHTVRNHIANMRRKLGAPTKLDLVRIAQELGYIQTTHTNGVANRPQA